MPNDDRRMMPPAVPAGPRPPRIPGATAEAAADLDRTHAALIRQVAQRMLWGTPAAVACRETAARFWAVAADRPSPFDVPTFRWLQELADTPDTPEGVVTLLRLADLTEWQTFDQITPDP